MLHRKKRIFSKKKYALKMEEASFDNEFIKRTMKVHKEFENIASDLDKEWLVINNSNNYQKT